MPAKTRRVVIREDYLDGIMACEIRSPSEFDEEVLVVPAELVKAYEAHERAHAELQERLRDAMRSAPRRKNPKYVATEE